MVDIEVGMLVECNISNLDQSLPAEQRTKFGYFVSKTTDGSSQGGVYGVDLFSPKDSSFTRAFFDSLDIKPVELPMSEFAQKSVLAMAQVLSLMVDALSKESRRRQAVIARAKIVLSILNEC